MRSSPRAAPACKKKGEGGRGGERKGARSSRWKGSTASQVNPNAALSPRTGAPSPRARALETEASGALGRPPPGSQAPIGAVAVACHRAATPARGVAPPRRPRPPPVPPTARGGRRRPLPPERPPPRHPRVPPPFRTPPRLPRGQPAPPAAFPLRRGARAAHLIVAAGAGARGWARGAGRGALAGEPAPGAAAPRLAGLRGAAGAHLLGAGVRAASCGKGLRRPRLTAGPRPLPSWRARARAGVCARRRERWKEGRGRRPPAPPIGKREGDLSPRAETDGASLRPLHRVGCARASLGPRPLGRERARRSKPDTKGAGPTARASGSWEPRVVRGGAGREGAGPRELGRGCGGLGRAGLLVRVRGGGVAPRRGAGLMGL